jgi:hypothetical protein
LQDTKVTLKGGAAAPNMRFALPAAQA